MEKVILLGAFFIELLVALSIGKTYYDSSNNSKIAKKFLVLCISYAINLSLYILVALTSMDLIRFIAYILMWCFQVIFLCATLGIGMELLDIKSKILDISVTVIYYSALISYFIDSIITRGAMIATRWGYYNSGASNLLSNIPHTFVYVVFLADIIYMYYIYQKRCHNKREKYQLILFCVTYIPIWLGMIIEIVLVSFNFEFMPVALLTTLISVILMKRLIEYNRSIKIVEADYNEWLRPELADPIIICDDTQKVLFLNKRAEIVAHTSKIRFINRSLEDIFLISEENENKMTGTVNKDGYSIDALSINSGERIKLDIKPVTDRFGEVLVNIVNLRQLEETKEDEVGLLAKGIRTLIVNENPTEAGILEGMLTALESTVTKIYSESGAINAIKNNTYDIILLGHTEKSSFGYDIAKAIRKLNVDYYKKVPIIIWSETSREDVNNDFGAIGYNDYLLKPVSAKQLQIVLAKWGKDRLTKEDNKAEDEKAIVDIKEAYKEIILSFKHLYDNGQYQLALFNVKGIKKLAEKLMYPAIVEKIIDIESALLIDSSENINIMLGELKTMISE